MDYPADKLTDLDTSVTGAQLDALKTKVDLIQAGATDDQTGAEIKALYEGEANTNAFTDTEKSKLASLVALTNNYYANRAPNANDDLLLMYEVGSLWIDGTNDEVYRCVDASIGSAVWLKTTLGVDELATIALTGLASDLIGSIATSQITNLAVTDAKLATDAVTTAKIFAGAVTGVKIANGAVGTDKIANGAISRAKLQEFIINGDYLDDNAVETNHVASIAGTKITVDASGFSGHLAVTDNTVQKVAEAVDALVSGLENAEDITDGVKITDDLGTSGGDLQAASFTGTSATTVINGAQRIDLRRTGSSVMIIGQNEVYIPSNKYLRFVASSNHSSPSYCQIRSGGDNILQQQNGTDPQTYQLCNTYTSATDYESLELKSNVTDYQIGSAVGSSGGTNRPLSLGQWDAAGTFTEDVGISTSGVVTTRGALNVGGTITGPTSLTLAAPTGAVNLRGGDVEETITLNSLGYTLSTAVGSLVLQINSSQNDRFDIRHNSTRITRTSLTAFECNVPGDFNSTINVQGTGTFQGNVVVGSGATISSSGATPTLAGSWYLGASTHAFVDMNNANARGIVVRGDGATSPAYGYWFTSSNNAYNGAVIGIRRNSSNRVQVSNNTGGDATLQAGSAFFSGSVFVVNDDTSSTDLERLRIMPDTTDYKIGSQVGSAGGLNRPIKIGRWDSAGTFSEDVEVSTDGAVTIANGTGGNVGLTDRSNTWYGFQIPSSSSVFSFGGYAAIDLSPSSESLLHLGIIGTHEIEFTSTSPVDGQEFTLILTNNAGDPITWTGVSGTPPTVVPGIAVINLRYIAGAWRFVERLTPADVGTTVQAYDADTAKLDAEQEWTATQRSSFETISYAAAVTYDGDPARPMVQRVTLTGDMTLTVQSASAEEEQFVRFRFDDTGGNTVTWVGVTGTAPTLTADDWTTVDIEYLDGAWRFVA